MDYEDCASEIQSIKLRKKEKNILYLLSKGVKQSTSCLSYKGRPMGLPFPPIPSVHQNNVEAALLLEQSAHAWELSEEVCKRIPNIKDLETNYISHGGDWNVGFLNKLESLRCSFETRVALKNLMLPNSLKELSYMAIIGRSLPHLQILHLLSGSVVGEEWNLDMDERFLSLKYLRIEYCDDLICWDAEASNFPALEKLFLERLSELEEIPSGIGDITALELMEINHCSKSAVMSAIKILEEQVSNENLDLHLQLKVFQRSEADMLKGEVQELGITSQNLHISSILT